MKWFGTSKSLRSVYRQSQLYEQKI